MAADVIVVGAGWAGLTAGAILARNGLQVQVLEATGHIGGRSACDRKDGFIVDYGIHIITYASAGAAARALREIGYEIEFLPYGKPLIFMDGEFSLMPTGVSSFLGSNKLSFADKMIIGHGVRRLIVSRTSSIADVPLLKAIPGAGRESVRDFYRILSALGLVTPDIEVASAGEFAKFLRRAMKAREQLAYPRGGSGQINEALAKKIRSSGEISLNSRVKALNVEDGRVRSVTVKDERLEARAVIFAAPAQKLPELAGESLTEDFARKCNSLIPVSGISLDLCLSRSVSDINSAFISADPIVLGQFTSNIDPSTAPAGKQLATFFRPVPCATMDDSAALDEMHGGLVSHVETMFPGIMDQVEWERVLKLKVVDGFEPRVGQTAKDRPPVRVPGIDNLFLAGDTVGIEGRSGDVAFSSGAQVAHQILEFLE